MPGSTRSLLVKPVGVEIRVNQAKHRNEALAESSVEIWKENTALKAVQSEPNNPQIAPDSN